MTKKKFAVFFAKPERFHKSLLRFDLGNGIEGISLDEFHKDFAYVGTFEDESPDLIFQRLQNGGGDLGVQFDRSTGEVISSTAISGKLFQDLVIRTIGHTSMSKGDVVADLSTGEILICASVGWDRLVVTGCPTPWA